MDLLELIIAHTTRFRVDILKQLLLMRWVSEDKT